MDKIKVERMNYQRKNGKFFVFLISIRVIFCPFSQAQVIFREQKLTQDSLKVSYFNESIRFIKPINNFFSDSAAESRTDSAVVAWLSGVGERKPVVGSGEAYAGAADRLRHIPSILPVRIDRREQYRVSSWFGLRFHPLSGRTQLHNGMDFPQPLGTAVYATADGQVRKVGLQLGGMGLTIQVTHRDGFATLYGHLSQFEVKPGQWVRRGQRIGRVGKTGLTTGSHLHYIVQYRGRAIDPKRYCFLVL